MGVGVDIKGKGDGDDVWAAKNEDWMQNAREL